MSKFEDKLRRMREETDIPVSEDAKLELLLCLKSAIDSLAAENELEVALQRELLTRIGDGDEDRAMSVGQMVQLYQILKKKKSEDLASIMGVLKQQIVIQQNNYGELEGGSGKKEREINPPSSDEVKKAKEVLDFIDNIQKHV